MSSDAIVLLKEDHKKVKGLFRDFEAAKKAEDKDKCRELVDTICQELLVHSQLEEQVFYPAAMEALPQEEKETIFEAEEEHQITEVLIGQLQEASTVDEHYLAKAVVLMEMVKHHIDEEESEMFPSIREQVGWTELTDMGEKMIQMKQQLKADELVAAAR